eukprot:CAMPEP_0174862100 /NCGR_PEP_ID=MMETSP1114-20130205/53238_1 /TAXON_ID=312471 /ORGANISM="Neobodo designis, Strain CCAP 1951/1" /LENGTH=38 /DNA_ID= /DNA_START= /DNA_END= /DNA_ORIENTATION=
MARAEVNSSKFAAVRKRAAFHVFEATWESDCLQRRTVA